MNVKISEMPSATSLDGTELVPIVQSGVSKNTTIGDLGGEIITLSYFDPTGAGLTINTTKVVMATTTVNCKRRSIPYCYTTNVNEV